MIQPRTDFAKKNDSSAKNTNSELNRSKCRLVKGSKPLQKYKFYLDIKNHAITTKLEGKIKELGGDVQSFLVQEVTHVISDRVECETTAQTGCTDSSTTPLSISNDSIHTNESSTKSHHPTARGIRQRTRADAMLEKVRSQPTRKVTNPLQNAKLWDIPIWTVNKIFSWLEKVSASITISSKEKQNKEKKSITVFSIKEPFLKFEPLKRNLRPVYKTLPAWPAIDLDSGPGKPAFSKSPDIIADLPNKSRERHAIIAANDSKMTRKQRTRLSVRGSKEAEAEKQTMVGGYCEICHCEYRELAEHVRSEQHLNFVKNDANFLELDSIIAAGANVEAFLRLNGNVGKDLNTYPLFGRRSLRKLNGKNNPEKCNGAIEGYSPPVTRNRTPRQRTSSNHSPLSPAGSDSGHHLRSRGQLWLPSNLLGTTAEDESYSHRLKDSRYERRSCRLTDDDYRTTKENDTEKRKGSTESTRPKRTCPKSKRVSADERLVSDNKTYYKVEVMSSKLRSSGLGNKEIERVRRSQLPLPEEEKDDEEDEDTESEEQGLVVKFKRVRRSELSVLNDEAENFMFPRKEDPSVSDIETDEGPNTTKSTIKSDTSDVKSNDSDLKTLDKIKQELLNEHFDDSLSESVSYETTSRRKRRRNDSVKLECLDYDVSNDGMNDDEPGPKRKRRRRYTECDEHLDESSKDGSVVCDETGAKRKKRRTQAEAFIADNQKYYKFETPGSRLRYQGSFFPQTITKTATPNKSNGECTDIKEEPKENQKPELSKNELKFSFEFIPKSESWYKTFLRQDKAEEYYISNSDDGYKTRFSLPYQLPYIAPLDPALCIEDYKRKKQTYLKFASEGSIDEKSDPSENISFANETLCEDGVSKTDTETPQLVRRRKKRSRLSKMNSTHPRKSPRQHASTLAILSSLIQQRKKRERKSQPDSDTSRASLVCLTEEVETQTSPKDVPPIFSVSENVDVGDNESDALIKEILSAPMDDLSDLDTSETNAVYINDKPDAISLLMNYDKDIPLFDYSVVRSPVVTETVRTVRRKRKKNRTGWPKKKRLFTKRCEQKSEDGNCSLAELEDSRLTEFSIDDDMKELCDDDYDNLQVCDNIRTNKCVSVNNTEPKENCQNNNVDASSIHGLNNADTNFCEVSEFTIQGDYKCTERINSVLESNRLNKDGVIAIHDVSSLTNNNCEVKKSAQSNSELVTNNTECTVNSGGSESDLNSESALGSSSIFPKAKSENISSEEDLYGFSDQSCSNFKKLEECLNQVILSQKPSDQILNKINLSERTDSDTFQGKLFLQKSDSDCQQIDLDNSNLDKKKFEQNLNGQKISREILDDQDVSKQSTFDQNLDRDNSNCENLDRENLNRNSDQRNIASNTVPEEMIANQNDRIGCVNVSLDKWENAEKVLHTKVHENETKSNDKLLQYQPFVRVQKIDNSSASLHTNRRLRSSSPERKTKVKKAKIAQPTSPRSPRKLRTPRGKWYRER